MGTGENRGGCYCGAVRYRVAGKPKNTTICYCEDCRRISAAPGVAWITVGRDQFEVTKGEPVQFESSPPVIRLFCGQCGTHIAYTHNRRPDDIDITTCSLDEPEAFAPREHTFAERKLSWAP